MYHNCSQLYHILPSSISEQLNSFYKLEVAITHSDLEASPSSGHWRQLLNKTAAVTIRKTFWRALSSVMLQKNKVVAFLSSVSGRINHPLNSQLSDCQLLEQPQSQTYYQKNKLIYASTLQQKFHTLMLQKILEYQITYFKTLLVGLLHCYTEVQKEKKPNPQIFHLPTLALRNLFPILWSVPIALATSSTSAPVASHRALIELMLLILWARKALAACR